MTRGDERRVSRKRFLDWLMGTSVGGLVVSIAYPVVRYWIPPDVAEAETNSVSLPFEATDLAANSGRIFKFGKEPGILIKTPDGALRAFSATCTHLACTVQYRDDLSHIWCACHNGHYDLNGKNIAGPPPRPLPEFDVVVRGSQVVVNRRS